MHQMASEAGVSGAAYFSWESGKWFPKPEHRETILTTLESHISPDWLDEAKKNTLEQQIRFAKAAKKWESAQTLGQKIWLVQAATGIPHKEIAQHIPAAINCAYAASKDATIYRPQAEAIIAHARAIVPDFLTPARQQELDTLMDKLPLAEVKSRLRPGLARPTPPVEKKHVKAAPEASALVSASAIPAPPEGTQEAIVTLLRDATAWLQEKKQRSGLEYGPAQLAYDVNQMGRSVTSRWTAVDAESLTQAMQDLEGPPVLFAALDKLLSRSLVADSRWYDQRSAIDYPDLGKAVQAVQAHRVPSDMRAPDTVVQEPVAEGRLAANTLQRASAARGR